MIFGDVVENGCRLVLLDVSLAESGQVGWSPWSRQVGFYPDLGLPDETPTV